MHLIVLFPTLAHFLFSIAQGKILVVLYSSFFFHTHVQSKVKILYSPASVYLAPTHFFLILSHKFMAPILQK